MYKEIQQNCMWTQACTYGSAYIVSEHTVQNSCWCWT